MHIEQVADIIEKINDGLPDACLECLERNSRTVVQAVTEQLYAGMDGEDNYLTPTYDNDPFFNEPGPWHNRAKDYKAWKHSITPPVTGTMLGLPPRPDEVPNLYINGKFYSEISARRSGDILLVDPGSGNGPDIVRKYGDGILELGFSAVEYFNIYHMLPAIETFFRNCGYS